MTSVPHGAGAEPARPVAAVDVIGLKQWSLAVAVNQIQTRNREPEEALALAGKYFEFLTGVRLTHEAAPVLSLVKGADHGA